MMMRPLGIPVILITATIIFIVVNALDGDTQRREAKRSDGLVRDAVHQMVAEHIERMKIMKLFREMQNTLDDVKRELKERNTLLHDTKFLQKKLLKEVKAIKKELKEELLEDLTKTMKGFNKTLKSIESENSGFRKETKTAEVILRKEIVDAKQRITEVKRISSKETKKLNYQLLILKNKTDHRQNTIAFSARLRSSITHGTTSRLVFSNVKTNIGGGYNSTDGVFYCPVDGVYLFAVTIQGYSSSVAYAYIMKNNIGVDHVFGQISSKGFPSASLSLALSLRSGDRIWIKGAGYKFHTYSFFTGVFIDPY